MIHGIGVKIVVTIHQLAMKLLEQNQQLVSYVINANLKKKSMTAPVNKKVGISKLF